MPIDYEIDRDSGILRIAYSGDLTLNEQLSFLRLLVERGLLRPGARILLDRRGVKNIAPTAHAGSAAGHLESWRDLFRGVKAAFVVSTPIEFGLVRMFSALASGFLLESCVFYSLDEANDWLIAHSEA